MEFPFPNGFCISKWTRVVSKWVLHFRMGSAFPNGLLHFRMGCYISQWVLHFRMGGQKVGTRALGRPPNHAPVGRACSRRMVPPKELSNRRSVQPKERPAEDFYPLAKRFSPITPVTQRRPVTFCHHSGHAASLFEGMPPIRKCKNAFGNAKNAFGNGFPHPISVQNALSSFGMEPLPFSNGFLHFEMGFAFRNRSLHSETHFFAFRLTLQDHPGRWVVHPFPRVFLSHS
jgi:hypothetical protein